MVISMLETRGLDELINILILYYLYKTGNMAISFLGNVGEALMKISKAWTEGL